MSTPQQTSGSHNTHARLAPSYSKTWTTCTAAVAYSLANKHMIPVESNTIWSDEGTIAHDYAANILLGKLELKDVPWGFRAPVAAYVNHCRSLTPEGVSYDVEIATPLYYQPENYGTCDFAVITPSKVIVRDLKYGAGVLVRSENNTQLAIYAYSVICNLAEVYDFQEDTVVDIKVVQPRHLKGHLDTPWVLPLSELRVFCDYIEGKAILTNAAVEAVVYKDLVGATPEEILALAPYVQFAPQEGDNGACRWCKSKSFCLARRSCNDCETPQNSASLSLMPDMTQE